MILHCQVPTISLPVAQGLPWTQLCPPKLIVPGEHEWCASRQPLAAASPRAPVRLPRHSEGRSRVSKAFSRYVLEYAVALRHFIQNLMYSIKSSELPTQSGLNMPKDKDGHGSKLQCDLSVRVLGVTQVDWHISLQLANCRPPPESNLKGTRNQVCLSVCMQ